MIVSFYNGIVMKKNLYKDDRFAGYTEYYTNGIID